MKTKEELNTFGEYDEVHGYYYNIYCLRKHTYEKGFEWEMKPC